MDQKPKESRPKSGLVFAAIVKLGPKFISLMAKLLKGLKVGKVTLAGASMASYAYLFTWQFALLIMVMLFIHESGHIWAMRKCGMKIRGIYFIPFVGGAAVAEPRDGQILSMTEEVFIAIMGPVWGLALTIVTAIAYAQTGNPIFAAAASWMALVNLFNLIPINPLDGGRILVAIAKSIHAVLGLGVIAVSLLAMAYFSMKFGLGLLAFLVLIGAMELAFGIEALRNPKNQVIKMRAGGIVGSIIIWGIVAGGLLLFMVLMSNEPGAKEAMDMLHG